MRLTQQFVPSTLQEDILVLLKNVILLGNAITLYYELHYIHVVR